MRETLFASLRLFSNSARSAGSIGAHLISSVTHRLSCDEVFATGWLPSAHRAPLVFHFDTGTFTENEACMFTQQQETDTCVLSQITYEEMYIPLIEQSRYQLCFYLNEVGCM